MTEEHQGLIEAIAQKDEKALARFHSVLGSVVYSFAYVRLRNALDAAEVLNEVMLEVWNGAHRYEGRSRVRTWVLGIANHKILDRLRKRRPETLCSDEQMERADEAPGPMELLGAAENEGYIRECLETLSESHRQVVYLAFFEDLPYSEIAAILNCPEGTVKTRMYHAKEQLRRCLSKKI